MPVKDCLLFHAPPGHKKGRRSETAAFFWIDPFCGQAAPSDAAALPDSSAIFSRPHRRRSGLPQPGGLIKRSDHWSLPVRGGKGPHGASWRRKVAWRAQESALIGLRVRARDGGGGAGRASFILNRRQADRSVEFPREHVQLHRSSAPEPASLSESAGPPHPRGPGSYSVKADSLLPAGAGSKGVTAVRRPPGTPETRRQSCR